MPCHALLCPKLAPLAKQPMKKTHSIIKQRVVATCHKTCLNQPHSATKSALLYSLATLINDMYW